MAGGAHCGQDLALTYNGILALDAEIFPTSIVSLTESLTEAIDIQAKLPKGTAYSVAVDESFKNLQARKAKQRQELAQSQQQRLHDAREARRLYKKEKALHVFQFEIAAEQERAKRARWEIQLQEQRYQARRLEEKAHKAAILHREELEKAKAVGESDARFERACNFQKDTREAETAVLAAKKKKIAPTRRPPGIRRHDASARGRVARQTALLKNERCRAVSKACNALREASEHVRSLSRVPWPDEATTEMIGKGRKIITQACRELSAIHDQINKSS